MIREGRPNRWSQDVVVVSVQYRLGVFGFLGSQQIRSRDPQGSTGWKPSGWHRHFLDICFDIIYIRSWTVLKNPSWFQTHQQLWVGVWKVKGAASKRGLGVQEIGGSWTTLRPCSGCSRTLGPLGAIQIVWPSSVSRQGPGLWAFCLASRSAGMANRGEVWKFWFPVHSGQNFPWSTYPSKPGVLAILSECHHGEWNWLLLELYHLGSCAHQLAASAESHQVQFQRGRGELSWVDQWNSGPNGLGEWTANRLEWTWGLKVPLEIKGWHGWTLQFSQNTSVKALLSELSCFIRALLLDVWCFRTLMSTLDVSDLAGFCLNQFPWQDNNNSGPVSCILSASSTLLTDAVQVVPCRDGCTWAPVLDGVFVWLGRWKLQKHGETTGKICNMQHDKQWNNRKKSGKTGQVGQTTLECEFPRPGTPVQLAKQGLLRRGVQVCVTKDVLGFVEGDFRDFPTKINHHFGRFIYIIFPGVWTANPSLSRMFIDGDFLLWPWTSSCVSWVLLATARPNTPSISGFNKNDGAMFATCLGGVRQDGKDVPHENWPRTTCCVLLGIIGKLHRFSSRRLI